MNDVQFNGLFFLVLLSLLKYTCQQGTTFRLYKKTYNILIERIVSALAGFHGAGSSMLVELEFGDVCFYGARKTGKPKEKPSEKDGNQQEIQLSHTVPESNPSQRNRRISREEGETRYKSAERDHLHLCSRFALVHHASRSSSSANSPVQQAIERGDIGGRRILPACSPQQSTNTVSFVPAENHTYNEKLISYYINFDLNDFFPCLRGANTCFCCCCYRSDFNHIDCFITRTLVRFAIV